MTNKVTVLNKFSDLEGRTITKILEDRYRAYLCIWFDDSSCCLPIPCHDSSRGSYVDLLPEFENFDYATAYDLGFLDEETYLDLKAKDEEEAEAHNKRYRRAQYEELKREFEEGKLD